MNVATSCEPCGASITRGMKVCDNCGTPVDRSNHLPDQHRCGDCGRWCHHRNRVRIMGGARTFEPRIDTGSTGDTGNEHDHTSGNNDRNSG